MGRRLVVGLLKGLALGAVLGGAVTVGLGWTRAPGLLGALLAMGFGASVGLVAGKPPWQRDAWIESTLRAVGGLVLGGVGYFVAARYGAAPLPLDAGPGAPAGTPWVELPLLTALSIGAIYGALVELDHTGEPPSKRRAPPSRPAPSAPPRAKPASAPPG